MDTTQDPPLLREIRNRLFARKAEWERIAEKSGCPLDTVKKIAYGHTRDPGIRNVEKLRLFFRIGLTNTGSRS